MRHPDHGAAAATCRWRSWPRSRLRSAGQALTQQALALLCALAALAPGAAEELRELGVAVALGVLGVLLHAQRVAQALLGEPDQVVVLVLRARDLSGLFGHHDPPA